MSQNSSIIKLNVGGKYFQTTVLTLVLKSGFFRKMFDPMNHHALSNEIFIDRSPHIFKHVLSFIRDVNYPYPIKYVKELDFYQVEYENFPDPIIPIINRMNKIEKHLYIITRELSSTNSLQIRQSPCPSPQSSPSTAPPMPSYGKTSKKQEIDGLSIDTIIKS